MFTTPGFVGLYCELGNKSVVSTLLKYIPNPFVLGSSSSIGSQSSLLSSQYVIELNAKDIKEIREYNKDVNDYLDYSLDCEDSYRCYSTFLTKFNNIVKTNNMRNMPNGSIYFYQR